MIFIAYDHNGIVTSIVNAKSRELAEAFWQGKGTDAFSVKSLMDDFTPLEEHPTGVVEILKTTCRTLSPFGGNPSEYVVVTK